MPGHFWTIERPEFVKVRSLDLDGETVFYEGDDLLGRVLLHEIGHLNGELLIDHLDRRTKKKALKTLREEALGFAE